MVRRWFNNSFSWDIVAEVLHEIECNEIDNYEYDNRNNDVDDGDYHNRNSEDDYDDNDDNIL